jgi:16S rRNA (cytosine967-C5)-methyltransferase
MIAPARLAAYDVLRAVSSGRSDLPSALARARRGLADERDRALAGEIATGTLRWQGAFDAVIAAFAGRPVGKLDGEILDILRLTTFQILYLDRIPVSAAVNDAVDLARKAGKKSAAGLVNAILRRISRERSHLPLPPRPAPEKVAGTFPQKVPATFVGKVPATFLGYRATTLSHPGWLVSRWLERYGFEATEAWELFDNSPAALTLRVNTLRTSRDELAAALATHGVETSPTRFASQGLTVTSGNPLLTPLADDGVFAVQDEASQLVAELTAVKPGERVLDACASPGGKTTAMAAAMHNVGTIVATDLRGKRVDLLRRTIANAEVTCAHVVQANIATALPFGVTFDCVLLDAPCSGLGTLRRDPDIRWRRTEESLAPLAATQVEMLKRMAAVVRPGGRLIYATCSSEPDENEAVVDRFLSSHAEFARAPDLIRPDLGRFRTSAGDFRTLPFRDHLEAFFAAMLVKTKDLR